MRSAIPALAAAAVLLVGGAARADTVSLIWQGTGTPESAPAPSTSATLNVVLTITRPDTDFVAFSIDWDLDGDDEFDFVTTSSAGASPNGTGWDDLSLFQQGNTAGNPGRSSQYAYEENTAASMAPSGPVTATLGTITFHVNHGVPDGVTIVPGFFDSAAFDNCFTTTFAYCNSGFVFEGASLVPEPGTLGLVGLGLAGLAWARRRRS